MEIAKEARRHAASILLVISLILSAGFVYYAYSASQYLQLYQGAESQLELERGTNLTVFGSLNASGFFLIGINNSGIVTTSIVAYFVVNPSTSSIIQYDNGTGAAPHLPMVLAEAQSVTLDTGLKYVQGESFLVKVLSSSGRVFSFLYG